MKISNHLVTVLFLFAGAIAAIALSIAMGFQIDLALPLGSRGILAFLAVTAVIFLGIEAAAGVTGEWIERHRPHRG